MKLSTSFTRAAQALAVAAALALGPTFTSAFAASSATPGDLHSIIAMARERLGKEDTLKAVTTLKFFGEIDDAKGQQVATVNLLFKKPGKQRIEYTYLNVEGKPPATTPGQQFTGTNEIMGWVWQTFLDGRNGTAIIAAKGPGGVEAIIDQSYEALNFFTGPDQVIGGSTTLYGRQTLDGKDCWAVTFSYPDGTSFTDYFDVTTGDLRATLTNDGHTKIVGSGQLIAGGITFPAQVAYYVDGKLDHTIKYLHALVNDPMDDALFNMPSLLGLYMLTDLKKPAPLEVKPPSAAELSTPSPVGIPPPDLSPGTAGGSPSIGPRTISVPPLTPVPDSQTK